MNGLPCWPIIHGCFAMETSAIYEHPKSDDVRDHDQAARAAPAFYAEILAAVAFL